MKKIININLSGRVIPIEDAAYESLQRYIDSLRRYFAREEGRDEIINDIESRIAELMNDKVRKGSVAITEADVEEIIASMGRVEDFEQADAAETVGDQGSSAGSTTANGTNTTYRKTKGRLYRDVSDKLLGGVCSGIANYMNVDPAIVRILFALITLGGFGAGILIYILLWIFLPANNLDSYVGKRLFRNPDDRMIGGVAGGLAAYFNKPAKYIRLIFAAPFIINIFFAVLTGIANLFHGPGSVNFLVGSFSGTFILGYIILWIVLPEANSPFEKMEMRGETVDVNRIRQNVQEGMSDFKVRMESWGEEVKTSAQQMSDRARAFAGTRGKTFASEVASTARPVGRGIGSAIGLIFKIFFLFIAACIALSLFGVLIALLFGGVAWWPINNFLWSSAFQQVMAWGTVLFFIAVPVVGFIVWLIRRIVQVRSHSRYLGWTFGGLWTLGWFCLIMLVVSVSRDLRTYDQVESELPLTQQVNDRLLVRVSEPRIMYRGGMWGIDDNEGGWDISEDTIRYNNVKIQFDKSFDNQYHVVIRKYSAGRSLSDAQARAQQTAFTAFMQDSVLNMGSGVRIGRDSKFRGQAVTVEIQIPEGKKIRFDDSVEEAYHPWVVRYEERRENRRWRKRYRLDWDEDHSFNWQPGVDYVMTADGKLKRPEELLNNSTAPGGDNTMPSADSLRRQIEDRQRQIERDRRMLEEIEQKRRETRQTQSTTSIKKAKEESRVTFIANPLLPLLM